MEFIDYGEFFTVQIMESMEIIIRHHKLVVRKEGRIEKRFLFPSAKMRPCGSFSVFVH
jgi:hypothetical protein